MQLVRQEARDILWGDNENWETIKDEIYDTSRWSTHHEAIFKNLATGKFYQAFYSKGATEQQDEMPWEYDETVIFTEVEPKEITTIEYVLKEEKE